METQIEHPKVMSTITPARKVRPAATIRVTPSRFSKTLKTGLMPLTTKNATTSGTSTGRNQ
jgi:hypothetical protein